VLSSGSQHKVESKLDSGWNLLELAGDFVVVMWLNGCYQQQQLVGKPAELHVAA
jgi:hypothetical protein